MKRTPEQRAALTRLHEILVGIDPDQLHMNRVDDVGTCGTAHCLLGWAIVDPWFKENAPLAHKSWFLTTMPRAREVFGLTHREADQLFATGIPADKDPHAVPYAQVVENLDAIMAGRATKKYRAIGRYSAREHPGRYFPA